MHSNSNKEEEEEQVLYLKELVNKVQQKQLLHLFTYLQLGGPPASGAAGSNDLQSQWAEYYRQMYYYQQQQQQQGAGGGPPPGQGGPPPQSGGMPPRN